MFSTQSPLEQRPTRPPPLFFQVVINSELATSSMITERRTTGSAWIPSQMIKSWVGGITDNKLPACQIELSWSIITLGIILTLPRWAWPCLALRMMRSRFARNSMWTKFLSSLEDNHTILGMISISSYGWWGLAEVYTRISRKRITKERAIIGLTSTPQTPCSTRSCTDWVSIASTRSRLRTTSLRVTTLCARLKLAWRASSCNISKKHSLVRTGLWGFTDASPGKTEKDLYPTLSLWHPSPLMSIVTRGIMKSSQIINIAIRSLWKIKRNLIESICDIFIELNIYVLAIE